jgi:DNA-binding winged helix-turn-helix (wHTH) protein
MDRSPIVLAHEEAFHIGPVEVRPSTREMLGGGRTAILEPRVMQVLVALWQAQGQVVSKDDLIARCWDQRVVGDDAINRVISRLRQNAEKDAGGAFRVETITRVGYRLRAADASAAVPTVDRRKLLVGGAAIGAVALAGWGISRLSGPPEQVRQLLSDGRDALIQGTPDQNANAVGKLRQAADLAPGNAEAWGLLSFAYQARSQSLPTSASDRARKLAIVAADRAQALDPDNAEAAAARLANISEYGNWIAWQRQADEVLSRHPDNFFANNMAGRFLYNVGRWRDAAVRFDKALEAEPNAPGPLMVRAQAFDELGRTAEAQAEIERAYRLWPQQYGVWFTRLYIFAYGGRVAEALAMCDDPAEWPVGVPADNRAMTRAQIVALGDPRESVVREAVDRTMAMSAKGIGFAENGMIFTGTMGLADRFFELAEAYFFDPAFTAHGNRFSEEQRIFAPHRRRFTFFLFRRTLGRIWSDPRFASLTGRIGLDAYWRAVGVEPDFRSAA